VNTLPFSKSKDLLHMISFGSHLKTQTMNYKVMIQQMNLLFLCFLRANTFSTAARQDILLRNAQKSDIPAISSINLRTLPENYTPYFYNSHISRWPQLAWVAEDYSNLDENKNPKIVAYVLGQMESNWVASKAKGHVTSLSVDPEYRRLGIGQELMERLHESLDDFYGAQKVVLHVRVSNKAALKLYQEVFSYKPIGTVKDYYHDGEDAYLMELELQTSLRQQSQRGALARYINNIAARSVKTLSRVGESQ